MVVECQTKALEPVEIIKSLVKYDEPLEGTNLALQLESSFKENASKVLIVDALSGREWTGSRLLDASKRIATNLIKTCNVKPEDTILIVCDHIDHEVVFALGVIFAGAAIFGSNPDDGLDELVTLCEIQKPTLIITQSRLHLSAERLRKRVSGLESIPIIWMDNPINSSTNTDTNSNGNTIKLDIDNNNETNGDMYADLIKNNKVLLFENLLNGHQTDEELINNVINKIQAKESKVMFLLTSGSTGKPKIVPSSHEQMVHQVLALKSAAKYPANSINGVTTGEPILSFTSTSVVAGDLPLDHGVGVNCILLSLFSGSKLIIMPIYNEAAYWEGINKFRITHSLTSTTFAYKQLKYLKETIKSGECNKWDLSCFVYFACAGSKLAFIDLIREVQSTYKQLNVVQAYGCTELGFVACLPTNEAYDHLESVGYLFPGLSAKLVDVETRKPVQVGSRGELLLWGKTKFNTYKCFPGVDLNDVMSSCHDQDNYYRTGDLANFDSKGRLYIHGRIKETLFLEEDWKILPAELEYLVNQHPLVELSAIIGVPNPDCPGTDSPRAFIKLISVKSQEFKDLLGLAESGTKIDDHDDCDYKELALRRQNTDLNYITKHIYDFVANRTAKPKHLRGGVYVLDEFPRNGILQKIDRKKLKIMQL